MKNKLTIVMIVAMAVVMMFNVSATSKQYVYEIDNITVILNDDSLIDYDMGMHIAHHLVYGDEELTTYGLWCNLFGHSYESYSAEKITHCVYDTDPRCQNEVYQVQVCTRCEHTVSDLIATTFISCCPEE